MDKGSNHKASLKISQDVIETIAKVSALEVDGVAEIASDNLTGIFSNGLAVRPINIKIVDGVAEINISLKLEFGAKISETSEKVQKLIKGNVQTMTGIMVSKVNISIEGIKVPNGKSEKEKAADLDLEDVE